MHKFEFLVNAGVIFPKTFNSWHCVKPIFNDKTDFRRIIVVQLILTQSCFIEWTIEADSHLQIEKELFAGLTSFVRNTIFAMAGIHRAGKTSFVNKMLVEGLFPNNAFVLAPDLVALAILAIQVNKCCKLF